MLKGWKTIGVGLLIAVGLPALHYLAGVDWATAVGPVWGPIIAGAMMIALRAVTTTPMFQSQHPAETQQTPTKVPDYMKRQGSGNAVIVLFALAGLLTWGTMAKAADVVPLKAPSTNALFSGYPYQGSGFYWGLSTGATSTTPTIDGQTATGLNAFGGSLGAAVGYQWGVGNVAYAVEGDFWWNNIGGSTTCDGASCSLTSRFSFEQRIKAMTPMSNVLGMFPALNNLPQLPGLPVLPQGVTTIASNPYIMVGLHEDDVSAGYGLMTGSAWQFSPGIGVGNLVQLSNKTALDTWAEWIPAGASFAVGPGVSASQGQQFRFGLSVLW